MTDGAVDARLDFCFHKGSHEGRHRDAPAEEAFFFHTAASCFVQWADVSTLTHLSSLCPALCSPGRGSHLGHSLHFFRRHAHTDTHTHTHLAEIFATGLSHYTDAEYFNAPLTTWVFICFPTSLLCLHLQLSCLSYPAPAVGDFSSTTPLIYSVYRLT